MLIQIERDTARAYGVSELEYLAAKRQLLSRDAHLATFNQITPDESEQLLTMSLSPELYLAEKNAQIAKTIAITAKSRQLSGTPGLTREEEKILYKSGLSIENYLAVKQQSTNK